MNIDIEQIRRWVRGTLSPDDRRVVGRWMLRSSDTALPSIVQGLIREHQEELADAALRARAPQRGFVLELWAWLLDSGRATMEALRPPEMAGGAVLGGAAAGSGLIFRSVKGDVVIDAMVAGEQKLVSVLATTDLADEHLLFEPTVLVPGTYAAVAAWTPEERDGRVTFWLVLAPATSDAALIRDLGSVRTVVDRGEAELVAARWTDP